jgi:hypothetical protein
VGGALSVRRGGEEEEAVIVDLIMQGVTIVLVIYFALHLRTQIRTVKSTVEAQKATIDAQAEQMKALKATIDAQAEQMKAQSLVLKDVERFYKIMQEVQLQREQAHRAMVERDAATLTLLRERFATWYAAVDREDFEWQQFATSVAYATLRDDLPEDLRQEIDLWFPKLNSGEKTRSSFMSPLRMAEKSRKVKA